MVTQLQTGSIKGGEGASSSASWYSPPSAGRSSRGVDFSSSLALSRTSGGIAAGPEVTGGDLLEASSFGHQVVYSAAAPRTSFASPDGLADLMRQSSPLDYRASTDLNRMNKLPAASSLLAAKSSGLYASNASTTSAASPKYFWQQEDFAAIDES